MAWLVKNKTQLRLFVDWPTHSGTHPETGSDWLLKVLASTSITSFNPGSFEYLGLLSPSEESTSWLYCVCRVWKEIQWKDERAAGLCFYPINSMQNVARQYYIQCTVFPAQCKVFPSHFILRILQVYWLWRQIGVDVFLVTSTLTA